MLIPAYVFIIPDGLIGAAMSQISYTYGSQDIPFRTLGAMNSIRDNFGNTPSEIIEYWMGSTIEEQWVRIYDPKGRTVSQEVLLELDETLKYYMVELYKEISLPADFPIDFTVTLLDMESILIRTANEIKYDESNSTIGSKPYSRYPHIQRNKADGHYSKWRN